MSMHGAAPVPTLTFFLSVASCSCVVTECVGRREVRSRFTVLPGAIWNWLGRNTTFFFFLVHLSHPESVCVSSHPRPEVLFYYDSVDQYPLGTMSDDRWPDNCVKGLIGLSGDEVALWDFLLSKRTISNFLLCIRNRNKAGATWCPFPSYAWSSPLFTSWHTRLCFL